MYRAVLALSVAMIGSAHAAPAPRADAILIQGNASGMQTVATDATGTTHAEYSYNDRGRGDHIVASWKLDATGIPVEYARSGNDYVEAPVEEHFSLKEGNSSWRNRAEHGEQAVKGGAGDRATKRRLDRRVEWVLAHHSHRCR